MIYFDNAATTFKKPDCVYKAVNDCLKKYSANSGRSAHRLSLKASEAVYSARENIARHFKYKSPENVVFTHNATYALNMAIKTLIPQNCHVIISDIEHNSVLRPIKSLAADGRITYSIYSSRAENVFKEIESKIRPDTKVIVSTIASNVTGEIIPFFALSELKRKYGLTLIVDASQAAGHFEIDLGRLLFDAFIAPAHKALFGIMGSGFCIFNTTPEKTFIEGGSGSDSGSDHMPTFLPERMEAGTVALPAIAALSSGVNYINSVGISKITCFVDNLTSILTERLNELKGVSVYGGYNGVVSFNVLGMSSETVAAELDEKKICVRAGLHCAPLAHITNGTADHGTVRISLSYFNTKKEIDKVYRTIKDLI